VEVLVNAQCHEAVCFSLLCRGKASIDLTKDSKCKNFGFHYMWVALPPKKMCTKCLIDNPRFAHVGLDEGRKHCGLSPFDVEELPTVSSACHT
jgi:hypothetical protein